jgi:hypothetical protein
MGAWLGDADDDDWRPCANGEHRVVSYPNFFMACIE